MKLPEVSMVWAMTPKGVIGHQGRLPWRLPRDMKRFRELTSPKMRDPVAVVMGPKTFAEIGKPLKGRVNIVLTTNRGFNQEGVLVAHDPLQAREIAAREGCCEFFVIGGAMVYTTYLPSASHLFVTYVWSDAAGDRHFPHWNSADWYRVWEEKKWRKGARDQFPTKFAEFKRKQTGELPVQSWRHPEEQQKSPD